MAEPTREQITHMRTSFESFLHNASLAALVVGPTLILLPPRKLDFYTFSLGLGTCLAGTQLYGERQARLGRERQGNWALPAQAQRVKEQLDRERGERRLLEESAGQGQKKGGSMLEEKAKEIWMGGETEGWKERRLAEERKKLAEGEGYGSMIMDQIWDVWTWGEKKSEGLKEKDEEVVKRKEVEIRREREFPRIGKD